MGAVTFESSSGKQTNGANGAANVVRTYAPATGELLGELPVTSRDEVHAVVARARKAQAAWAVLPVAERAERLLRLRDALVERAEEVVEIVSRECGKPRHEALVHEVMATLDLTSYWCKRADRILAPRTIDLHLLKHRRSVVHYVPRGVIGVISPWNFPFIIP